jgi:hypothetical protein
MSMFETGMTRAQIESVISAQISSICIVRGFVFPYVYLFTGILQNETQFHLFANKEVKLKVKG